MRADLERELLKLDVPRLFWSRIVAFMFYRLGTDWKGDETCSPCRSSHHSGQKALQHASYAMFSPFQTWSSNYYIDESSPVPSQGIAQIRLRSAEERFNRLREEVGQEVFFDAGLLPRGTRAASQFYEAVHAREGLPLYWLRGFAFKY